jgi:phosphate transport system ATP-binding protein
MSHIALNGLSVRYGGHTAVNNISVELPDRQITAIVGPSGCGKTTLLKSLNRLVELQDGVHVEGQVRIDGRDIYAPGADVLALRQRVGFLPQRPFPLPMSIYDNVAFGPQLHGLTGLPADLPGQQARPRGRRGEMDARVEHYLRLAGLWEEVRDRLNGPAARLSVGQQQRLALARTLAVEPEVILADEPTSALDPVSAKLVESRFQELKHRYTIVVVTHILRQARRIADYVLFMYLGELIEHGVASQVLANPSDQRMRAYVTGEIS